MKKTHPMQSPGHLARAEARRARAIELNEQGTPLDEIAAILKVRPVTVQSYIKEHRREIQRILDARREEAAAVELARIEHLHDEAAGAWEESKKNAVTETEEEVTSPDGTVKRKKTVTKGQCGNPAFLRAMHGAIELHSKLFDTAGGGSDEPSTIEGTVVKSVVVKDRAEAAEVMGWDDMRDRIAEQELTLDDEDDHSAYLIDGEVDETAADDAESKADE